MKIVSSIIKAVFGISSTPPCCECKHFRQKKLRDVYGIPYWEDPSCKLCSWRGNSRYARCKFVRMTDLCKFERAHTYQEKCSEDTE